MDPTPDLPTASPRRGRPSRVAKFHNLVGVLPDRAVAQAAGCSPSAVGQYRRGLGMAPVRVAIPDGTVISSPASSKLQSLVVRVGELEERVEKLEGVKS